MATQCAFSKSGSEKGIKWLWQQMLANDFSTLQGQFIACPEWRSFLSSTDGHPTSRYQWRRVALKVCAGWRLENFVLRCTELEPSTNLNCYGLCKWPWASSAPSSSDYQIQVSQIFCLSAKIKVTGQEKSCILGLFAEIWQVSFFFHFLFLNISALLCPHQPCTVRFRQWSTSMTPKQERCHGTHWSSPQGHFNIGRTVFKESCPHGWVFHALWESFIDWEQLRIHPRWFRFLECPFEVLHTRIK